MPRRVPRYLREPVDPSKLAHWMAWYVPLPEWWQDQNYTCRDCGSKEVWTAAEQKWWFEEARGPEHSRAVRCLACRVAIRERHGGTPRRSHRDRYPGAGGG